jgi:signal transduction histidine kinase
VTSIDVHELAHRINNALSVIVSHAEMLATNLADDDPRREALNDIATAGYGAATDLRALVPQLVTPR